MSTAQPGASDRSTASRSDADPIITEVIRHGLDSAAEQMKRALVRTAFSPVIFEVLDFAVAIYDRQVRLLAQAPSLPLFMGTMSYCVEAAVAAIGGEQELEAGDILLYNLPYGSGSHPQDAALVMPVFLNDEALIGYTAVKGHWLDIGGKEPLSTDTVDVFQEGVIFPGIKLFRRGELVSDIFRTVIANTRVPAMVAGDLNAEAVAVRIGAQALVRLVERYGLSTFQSCVERIYDHGEMVVRNYLSKIPDGRYVAKGALDDNGVDGRPLEFEIAVEISGSDVRVDYTNAPDAQPGPFNVPVASTISASRIAISMLAGGGGWPNHGFFRPIEVLTRPGSMFHALSPSPTNLYSWPSLQSIEVIYRALAQALPESVPASSGGCLCALVWWGNREATGLPWADGSPHPIGQGANHRSDGASALMHVAQAATRFSPIEVWEARNPWFLESSELSPDSGGAGEFQGGLGVDMLFTTLEDCWLTCIVERTKNEPWGLAGGLPGRPNSAGMRSPDGSYKGFGKVTRLRVPRRSTIELHTGGGGGYGSPEKRTQIQVDSDLAEGYITEEYARANYPRIHANQQTAT